MGARTMLVLFALVAALGVTLWFTSEKPPARTSAAVHALDGRSLLQCKRVRWQFPDQAAMELARGDDGVFRLAEPIIDRASRGFAQQLVQVWDSANLFATEYVDDEAGRIETGLTEPKMTFLAEWSDGHLVEYDVGEPGPLGTDRFLRRDGKIWRGGNGLFESMRINLTDLRDRQVFVHREIVCRELSVESETATGKRETIHLERVDNAWRMRKPVDTRAQPRAAIQFVTAILSLRADTFLSGLVRVPERDPDVIVRANGSFGTEELRLWIEQGAAFGQLPGRTSWFQCEPRNFEAVFENAANRLRARTLVGLTDVASEMAEVVIDPGQGRGDRVHLLRKSAGSPWILTEPVEYVTNPTRANELVQAVNNLRAIEFVDDKPFDDPALGLAGGLGGGRLALSVRGFEEQTATTLWIGTTVQRGDLTLVHACRADETSTVVLVPHQAIDRLRREWATYCARQIVRIVVQIERLEVTKADGSDRRVYKNNGEHWVEEGKAEPRPEVGEFANEDLRDLVARRAIDLRGDRIGEPDYILNICRADGDPLQVVRVWDRGGQQPVVLQPQRTEGIGFEVGVRDSKLLRELWR